MIITVPWNFNNPSYCCNFHYNTDIQMISAKLDMVATPFLPRTVKNCNCLHRRRINLPMFGVFLCQTIVSCFEKFSLFFNSRSYILLAENIPAVIREMFSRLLEIVTNLFVYSYNKMCSNQISRYFYRIYTF